MCHSSIHEPDTHSLANCLIEVTMAFGLTIKLRKTDVMRRDAPTCSSATELSIGMEGTKLKEEVNSFTYLGSCVIST